MPRKKPLEIHRTLQLDLERADQDNRTIPVIISTESPVDTHRGPEILIHSRKAIDLARASKRGLPLIFDHNQREILGRVKNVKLKNRQLVGAMQFSRGEAGQRYYQDVIDKIITDVSVGGRRLDFVKNTAGGINVTRWQPFEVSLTAIGADPAAGIERNQKRGDKMPEFSEVTQADKDKFIERGRKAELDRQTGIKGLFKRHQGHDDLMDTCLADGKTLERSRELLLNALGEKSKPVTKGPGPVFTHGEDQVDKFAVGVTRALSVRVGSATEDDKKDIGQNPFISYSPVEIARHFLAMQGHDLAGKSRQQIVGDAFTRGVVIGTATSSDFPNILADVAAKSMLKGYNETDETWPIWCQVGNLADFKEALRVNLSEFDNLPEVPEGGEYTHGKFTDLAEKIKLLTYGKLFTISRQALINDDLSALGRIPMGMGRAAARKVGDLAYEVLVSNPTMNQDGIALFDADHLNIGTPGIPSVESVDEANVSMGLQTGPAGEATLGIRPAYGICPLEIEGVFKTLMAAQYDPAADAGTLTPNPTQGTLTVVSEHRLSVASATAWYLAANQGQHDTVEVAFLDGNQNPYLEQQEGFTRDGVSHKVRIDAAAAPMDFRGLFYNAGA